MIRWNIGRTPDRRTYQCLERVRDDMAELDPLDEPRHERGLPFRLTESKLGVLVLPVLIVYFKGQLQIEAVVFRQPYAGFNS